MFPEERRRRILEQMRSGEAVKVADLCTQLGVSEASIRRDLRELERSGLLARTHGGALPNEGTMNEPSFAEKATRSHAEKVAIARLAAGLVQDGESLILDAGTTTLEIARQLRQRKDLTVITNAFHIAAELSDCPGIKVLVTGGEVRGNTLALVGPVAERTLADVNADRLFLGANGIDLKRGITTPTQAEAAVKRTMIESARQIVLVADHTKLGKVAFATIAPVTRAHVLVTDRQFDPHAARELTARGLQLLIAQ
ncbi:MAG: DeoR-family transcriptional regulator [Firmicutes bacterium]|nr:DeoR-family transcriptional regulator [Bacillota bacterium]